MDSLSEERGRKEGMRRGLIPEREKKEEEEEEEEEKRAERRGEGAGKEERHGLVESIV